MPAGLMVIEVVPVPVTFESVTAMLSNVESSLVFLIRILPDSRSTTSLKVSTMFALTATFTALSDGTEEFRIGLEQATALPSVKLQLSADIK